MIRFLFRLLATLALAVAVVMAVLDASRTVAASQLVLTPLGMSWEAVSPSSLAALRAAVEGNLHPAVWDPGLVWMLAMPGFAVLGALALLLYLIGRKPVRPAGRFAADV